MVAAGDVGRLRADDRRPSHTGMKQPPGNPSLQRVEPSSQLVLDPAASHVLLDFDGTITTKDVLDELIAAFARDDSWRAVEQLWQAGKIGSRECLTREFDCVRVGPADLAAFLDRIPIDPGLAPLLDLLHDHAVPVTILSDGVEMFIRRILSRANLGQDIPVRSNRVEHQADRLTLVCPYADATCQSAAAHCKCASARHLVAEGRVRIYVGDGRSDLCPSRVCDVVFAKGALARHLAEEGRRYIPYQTLAEVAAALSAAFGRHADRSRLQTGGGR